MMNKEEALVEFIKAIQHIREAKDCINKAYKGFTVAEYRNDDTFKIIQENLLGLDVLSEFREVGFNPCVYLTHKETKVCLNKETTLAPIHLRLVEELGLLKDKISK